VKVSDIQDVIETALGGKAITMTVEGRERFPVRVRYNRESREDEEDVKNLLVSATTSMGKDSGGTGGGGMGGGNAAAAVAKAGSVQVPLSAVADVNIVEGPAMIKSENGMLRNYVQLNVRDRILWDLSKKPSGSWHKRSSCLRGCISAGAASSRIRSAPEKRCSWCSRPSSW